MVKLDLKAKKILYQLDVNSRQPNSEIAKKVGLSKQVVGFRIKQLLKDQLLSSSHTVIDISKLGFAVHKSFIRLQNIDSRKEKELINFLKQHPNTVWLASCDGKFDLALGTWASDISFLDKTLTELNKKFGEYISERQIATIIRGEYFTRDYLINNKTPSHSRPSVFGSTPSPIKLDQKDWQILVELGKSSRITAVEIAAKINLSPDAVSSRIKKLETSGVIKHYNIVPNESVFPFQHHKVLMGFRNLSEERETQLIEYCRVNPNIVYIVKALGPWEFEIDLEVENSEKLRSILMEIKTKFSDLLKDLSVLNVYQVHKYNFCPSVQV